MHGKKREDYKARLKEPKVAEGLSHKAQQWHALMDTLSQQRSRHRQRGQKEEGTGGLESKDVDGDEVILASAAASTTTTMDLVEKALLVNPDPSHLWNHRRELVQQYMGEQEHCDKSKILQHELTLTQSAIQRNPKAYGAWFHRKWTIRQLLQLLLLDCSSSSSSTTTTATGTAEKASEQQSSPMTMITLLNSEIALTAKLLSLDERNFHCWNYRRYAVDALATSSYIQLLQASSASSSEESQSIQEIAHQMDGSWKLFQGSTTSMGAQIAADAAEVEPAEVQQKDASDKNDENVTTTAAASEELRSLLLQIIQSEWKFTQTKIQDNFSNFSAFYYRSQLLPLLHQMEKATTTTTTETGMTDRMEEEFQLVENAMCTEPDDQTAWWYHAILLDFIVANHQVSSSASSSSAAGGGDDVNSSSNDGDDKKKKSANTEDDAAVDYYKNRLQQQAELLRELLAEESSGEAAAGSGGKWILLGLHRILHVLTDKLRCVDEENLDAYRSEQVKLLNQLIQVDPDRTQRYLELIQLQQEQQHTKSTTNTADNKEKPADDGAARTAKEAAPEKRPDASSSSSSPQHIIDTIQTLSTMLQNDEKGKCNAPQLTHYRVIPNNVQQAYNVLQQGSTLIYSTSTKYTLVGKMVANEQYKLANDLLRGCELIGAATLSLLHDSSGCCRSVKHSAIRACLSIFVNVTRLIESFQDGSALVGNVGAQKTGAVWQSCDTILQKLLPIGNRTAIRRDLFTYTRDCNDTMEEFQELIDLGASSADGDVAGGGGGGETTERANNDQQYTEVELPIARACVGLIKCSRGCMKLSLETCEELGNKVTTSNDKSNDEILNSIAHICDLANVIGVGVTDLGSLLYPPLISSSSTRTTTESSDKTSGLFLSELKQEVSKQVKAIILLNDYIISLQSLPSKSNIELAQTLRSAVQTRKQEADDAMLQAEKGSTI